MVQMRRSPRCTSPLPAMASLALSWVVGCGLGCSKPPDLASTPATRAPGDDAAELGARPAEVDDAANDAEIPLLPVLNREALTARVAAQQAVLGRRGALFEDGQGRPVPWLSAAGPPLGDTEFDVDLLDELPGSSGLGGGTALADAVNGNALGLFTPMEPEDGESQPLQPFYDALRRLADGHDPDGKVRVLAYGASHTDADVYPHYLRAYLQERFGDGGHGFVHVAKPWRWYRHVDMGVEGEKRWITEHAQRSSTRQDGLFGLLGASLATKSKKAFGRVAPRNGSVGSRYEIYYLGQPRGGSFRVLADGERIAKIKTKAAAPTPGYHAFELPEGEHTIEIQPDGNGEVRLFGMTVERDQPGVVVDTLGIGGTRASNMLHWDEAVWGDNVAHRDPDLMILAYGTNEATDSDRSIDAYDADLREVIAKVQRVAPHAACLLVGPGDFPLPAPDGSWLPRPRLAEIIEVQRRVAAELGCAFWDAQAFMGGELSMPRWASSNPPMARDDHIHLTRRGYVRMGMALVDAMMVPFDDPASI